MLTIHHSRRARSVRVIWLLEELGIAYELRPIGFTPEALKSPEYLKLHPLGQIPVVQDGDITMIESGAIVEYLLERYGAGRLVPPPAPFDQRAEYLQWFHFGEASAARSVSDIVRDRFYMPESDRVPESLPQSRKRYRAAVELIDRALASRDFICGSSFSAADIMVSYPLTIGKVIGELPPEFANVASYLGRLKERPGYARAWAA
jgi:glutathione S-transferase